MIFLFLRHFAPAYQPHPHPPPPRERGFALTLLIDHGFEINEWNGILPPSPLGEGMGVRLNQQGEISSI